MPYEVELKYRMPGGVDLVSQLITLGARPRPQVTELDTYFAHPVRRFDETDEALRLRQVGDANRLTYKGPKVDAASKTRIEVDLPLGPGAVAVQRAADLLARIGFETVATVAKQRQVFELQWQGWQVVASLDTVEELGEFVELETTAEELQIVRAREALQDLASHLGLTGSIRESYLELLLDTRRHKLGSTPPK
jgi:adenylate cyclase class 2